MSNLFKKHLKHAWFFVFLLSFLSSLELYINHIPRWWARIFFEYKMISYTLFMIWIWDIYSPLSVSLSLSLSLSHSPFLFPIFLWFCEQIFRIRKNLQLWNSKAHYTLCIKLIIYEQVVSIVPGKKSTREHMSKISAIKKWHERANWERRNDEVRNNNVTRAPDQLHHHKHSFFIFAFWGVQ
jgi:hypothetical protein